MIEPFSLFTSFFPWCLVQNASKKGLIFNWRLIQSRTVSISESNWDTFCQWGSTTILRSAFQVFGGRSLLGSWSGRAVAERTVGNLFMEFMKLEMLVDWVFPGQFIYFAASDAFGDGFGLGEFDVDVGEVFHLFPIFHLIPLIIAIISMPTNFCPGFLFLFIFPYFPSMKQLPLKRPSGKNKSFIPKLLHLQLLIEIKQLQRPRRRLALCFIEDENKYEGSTAYCEEHLQSWCNFVCEQFFNSLEPMPFKLRLITQFQKSVRALKNQADSDPHQEEEKENKALAKAKTKSKKRLIDKNFNFFQLIYKREPIMDHHVVNFYNILGLNEKAITSPDFEESKFTTIFYIKNVKKVEIRPNFINLQLCNSPLSFPPIQYIIERYKSFGDARFYSLALLLQETSSRLKSIGELKITENVEDNEQYFDKYVQSLGNRMFVCRSTTNRLVISKSLLTLLEYNSEEMALEIVKYKAPLFEIFSAQRYFDIIFKMIQNLKNLFDLINDKISLETFLNSSLIRFKDHLITKHHKKIFCKLKVGMPNPMLNLIEVEEVLYKSEEFDIHSLSDSVRKMKIEEIQSQREISEISTIRRILPLPKNLLPENKTRVASYSTKPQQSSSDSVVADQ